MAMVSGTFADVSNPLVKVTNQLPDSKPYLEFVNKSDEGNKWGAVNNGVAEWVVIDNSIPFRNAVVEYIESTYDLTPFNGIDDNGYENFDTLPSEWTEI